MLHYKCDRLLNVPFLNVPLWVLTDFVNFLIITLMKQKSGRIISIIIIRPSLSRRLCFWEKV